MIWVRRITRLASTALLAGLACDGAVSGLLPCPTAIPGDFDRYRFSQAIERAMTALPDAEPDHLSPYLGPLVTRCGEEVGRVLLSSCGCGFWRAYAEVQDERFLARIDFPGFPDSFRTFQNAPEESLGITGEFIEEGQSAFGELAAADTVTRFIAERQAESSTLGCVLCHVGDDPPVPLPDTHRAVTPATDCLSCHEIAAH